MAIKAAANATYEYEPRQIMRKVAAHLDAACAEIVRLQHELDALRIVVSNLPVSNNL
jgi:hypothetical protein